MTESRLIIMYMDGSTEIIDGCLSICAEETQLRFQIAETVEIMRVEVRPLIDIEMYTVGRR